MMADRILAFGGNPANVVIWGGSAGGGSVSLQLTAGGAYDDPPFAAAIPEYPWWVSRSTTNANMLTLLAGGNLSSTPAVRRYNSRTP